MRTLIFGVITFASFVLHAGDAAASNEVIFVKADGWELTASAVSNIVMVQARVRELARKPVKPETFPLWANRAAYNVMHGMLYTHLLESEFIRRGVSRTPESDAEILSRYNQRARQKDVCENDLVAKFGSLEGTFREQFARDSLLEAGFRGLPECEVTDADVKARYQTLSNRMARVEKINKKAYLKAEKAYARLNAGESWETVATNMTEDALIEETYSDNWKDWGTYKLAQIETEDLMKALLAMKPGDYTKPIETDEGLVIVRLVAKDEEFYSLARILFRMGVKVEFPEPDLLRQQLVMEKRDAYQEKILPILRDQAKVEYPLGTNFVYKIWKEPTVSAKREPGMPLPRRFMKRR